MTNEKASKTDPTDGVKITPMFEQYLGIKEQYPDALLFYRMGDFFELFFTDAEITARELQLTLTSRNPNAEVPIAMCGIPHHALEAYLPQLLAKGYTVVICDQVENPKEAKGLVKRAVTRILTPGTVVDESSLSTKEHNFLGALYWDADKKSGGFAWVDNSTGFWTGLQSNKELDLWQWVQKIAPRELLMPEISDNKFRQPASVILESIQVVRVPFASFFAYKGAAERVLKVQNVQELDALGLSDKTELTQTLGALVVYLVQTQRQNPVHLQPFSPLNLSKHLIIDDVTERNLEIFKRLDGKKGSGTLWSVLDETITPMGGRMLEEMLRQPWRDVELIKKHQEVVEHFFALNDKHNKVRTILKQVYDIERLSTRISLDRAMPKDFLALSHSLRDLPRLAEALSLNPAMQDGSYSAADECSAEVLPTQLKAMLDKWDNLDDISTLLQSALPDTMPQLMTDGGLFRQGYNAELDELINLAEHGEQLVQTLLEKERAAYNLPKLKLGYNRVFGYYFEISKGSADKAPEHFQRRQTLANAERFTTPELKELEEKLMAATEKRNRLEYTLFQELRARLAAVHQRFMYMARFVAMVDYWQGLAWCARRNVWVRPELDNSNELSIVQGRHPVVEAIQGKSKFIPNDLHMDQRRRLILITGPNMAGKSTILRQTAIICLLAQIGSFVPAKKAALGVTDRIFSRVGASDNLAQGQSTFMVEMMETARILRQAGKRSLVILDEIGRGTSTYDGLSIAWAVVEDLATRASGQVRTLFATHYHELTVLDGTIAGVHNMNVAIKEWGGELVFLRRLVPGPSNRSYGIEVAKLAGVPQSVIQRAKSIMQGLEYRQNQLKLQPEQNNSLQLLPGMTMPAAKVEEKKEEVPAPEHPLLITLGSLDINTISPMQAFDLLQDWKMLWGDTREH